MKRCLLSVLMIFNSCSLGQVSDPVYPGAAMLSETDFVTQIPPGQTIWSRVDGRRQWRNPAIHIDEVDTVVVECLGVAGNDCTEVLIENLSATLRSLPTTVWPNGRSIVLRYTIGTDLGQEARIRRQVARVRAVAQGLQIQIVEQAALACG